ncbi:MAG: MFS transporter [Actinobacteria bacterium]|nr:MFS transporter [Actinomycetota bacterium]
MRVTGPYVDILRRPGAARFTAAAFVARLPISMVALGIVLMVSELRGSYALAGVVAAAYTVSSALINPLGSRAVDRWGQLRVVRVLVTVHAVTLLLLAWSAVAGWSPAALIALAVISGATQPATGALVRARWAHALGPDNRLRTAFAFEGVLDELIFIVGPPLATFLAVALSAPAPVIAAAALVAVGSTLLLAQRSTEPPAAGRPTSSGGHPLRRTGMPAVLIVLVAIGGVFGSIDVATVALADDADRRALAGLILAAYAAGSMASALVVGARSSSSSDARLPRVLLLASLALLAVTLPLLLRPGLLAFGILAFVAGLAVSPVLITCFTLVEVLVRPSEITEGLSWAISSIGIGVAASAAGAGWLIDQAGPQAGLLVTLGAACLVAVVALAGHGRVRRGVHARHA